MPPIKTYRKTALVQAIQWTGTNLEEVTAFISGREPLAADLWDNRWQDYEDRVRRDGLTVHTLENPLKAAVGSFICKGVKGEHWPVAEAIFRETYEEV